MSEHFSLEALTRSELAMRKGIDNTPTPEIEGRRRAPRRQAMRASGTPGNWKYVLVKIPIRSD
jgi:hypothetical protein